MLIALHKSQCIIIIIFILVVVVNLGDFTVKKKPKIGKKNP